MKGRIRRWLTWIVYPLAYLLLLGLFARCTFPYDRLKDRLIGEFNARQGNSGLSLKIGEMSGYWLSGIEAEDVSLTHTPRVSPTALSLSQPGAGSESHAETVRFDWLFAEPSLLSAIMGTTKVSFGVEVEQGSAEGEVVSDEEGQAIELGIETFPLPNVPMLKEVVGMPLKGSANGQIELLLPGRQLAKAEGHMDIQLSDVKAGDGKSKILNTIALPELNVGRINLGVTVKDGRLKFDSVVVKGADLDLELDGSIRLREPLGLSVLDLTLRFRFSDAYKNKNDVTRGLFGTPGSAVPGAFDFNDKVRRSKASDGFYGWRIMGTLDRPLAEPSASAGAGGRSTTRATKGARRTSTRSNPRRPTAAVGAGGMAE